MPGEHGPSQVRMTVEVERLAHQELRHIGIAACAKKIVATTAVFVFPILYGLPGDRQHRSQIGQHRPEPVEVGEVSALELTGARRPEALTRILQIPGVEIDDLRPLDRNYATDLPGSHRPGVTSPNWHNVLMRQSPAIGLGG